MELSEKTIKAAENFSQERYNYEVSYIPALLKELRLSEDEKRKLNDWLESHLKTCCKVGYMKGVSDTDTCERGPNMEELIENEFDEKWVKVKDENVLAKIENCLAETKGERFCLEYVADVEPDDIPRMIIGLHGGLNGNGRWDVYLMDIITIIHRLSLMFANVTILDIKNDVLDDVFDVRIVVSDAIKD